MPSSRRRQASTLLLALPSSRRRKAGTVVFAPPTSRRRKVGTVLFALLCAALVLPAGTSAAKRQVRASVALAPTGRTAEAGCANADLAPAAGNLGEIRDAILCLHNEIRADNGLPPLRENARLRRAATSHSADMVAERFFDHTTPDGATMVDRILRARYARRDQGWALGENLAWGTGRLGTPAGVMRAWMSSPGHRANILRRSYREIGIGIVTGIPSGASAGATYTADFGVQR